MSERDRVADQVDQAVLEELPVVCCLFTERDIRGVVVEARLLDNPGIILIVELYGQWKRVEGEKVGKFVRLRVLQGAWISTSLSSFGEEWKMYLYHIGPQEPVFISNICGIF